MNFKDLPFGDQQEITNSLISALGAYALGPDGKGNPLAHAPVENAVAHAPLVYESGWAKKVVGKWEIDLREYLEFRSQS